MAGQSLLREHQLHLLEMLCYLDSVCKKYQIRYFLVGGSALGAVRHQGFIPWDDDIDVAMPRIDLEKFERAMTIESHPEFRFEPCDTHSFPHPPFAFISRKNPLNSRGVKVPCLDIFPLDGVPESLFLQRTQELASFVYHLSVYREVPKNRGALAARMSQIFLTVCPSFILSIMRILAKAVVVWKRYDNAISIANIYGMARYKKEIMPRQYIGKGSLGSFEGKNFPIPENYDSYLQHLYGNYMNLPPESKRVPAHEEFQ